MLNMTKAELAGKSNIIKLMVQTVHYKRGAALKLKSCSRNTQKHNLQASNNDSALFLEVPVFLHHVRTHVLVSNNEELLVCE